eukprot:1466364-Pyramimonas_sp.AAC.1
MVCFRVCLSCRASRWQSLAGRSRRSRRFPIGTPRADLVSIALLGTILGCWMGAISSAAHSDCLEGSCAVPDACGRWWDRAEGRVGGPRKAGALQARHDEVPGVLDVPFQVGEDGSFAALAGPGGGEGVQGEARGLRQGVAEPPRQAGEGGARHEAEVLTAPLHRGRRPWCLAGLWHARLPRASPAMRTVLERWRCVCGTTASGFRNNWSGLRRLFDDGRKR